MEKTQKILIESIFMLIAIGLFACNEGKSESAAEAVNGDTVAMSAINLQDSTIYQVRLCDTCKIEARVEIGYPKFYVNKEKTDALQRLFAASVLGVSGDSITLATAFPMYVDGLMTMYRESDEPVDEDDVETDYEPSLDCRLNVRMYPVYNDRGIISICKEETVTINDKSPITRHLYYSFDLTDMSRLSMTDIFDELGQSLVNEMLKERLRTERGVENDDELVNLGYYNVDNMRAGDNFYVAEDSIVWHFLPGELSVLDEVSISLNLSSVKEIVTDDTDIYGVFE